MGDILSLTIPFFGIILLVGRISCSESYYSIDRKMFACRVITLPSCYFSGGKNPLLYALQEQALQVIVLAPLSWQDDLCSTSYHSLSRKISALRVKSAVARGRLLSWPLFWYYSSGGKNLLLYAL